MTKIGENVCFIIERSPTPLMKRGTMHAGTIVAIRGRRITIQDANGYRYTVDLSSIRF